MMVKNLRRLAVENPECNVDTMIELLKAKHDIIEPPPVIVKTKEQIDEEQRIAEEEADQFLKDMLGDLY